MFRVWDDVAGPELERWPVDGNALVAVAGTTALVHIREANEVRNWPDGRLRFKIPHDLWSSGSLSPDGRQLATLAWNPKTTAFAIELRDAMTGKVLWRNAKLRAENDVLAFMSGGKTLLVRTRDGQLVALDAQNGALQRRIGSIPSGHLGWSMTAGRCSGASTAAWPVTTWRRATSAGRRLRRPPPG